MRGVRMITANGRATFTVALVFLACAAGGITKADVYDLAADWSDVSNPNGVWSYYLDDVLGQSSTRTTVFDSYENNGDSFADPPGAPKIWTTDSAWPGYGYVGWSKSNGSEPSYWDLEAGDVYGYTSYFVIEIRWTSPVDGPIHVNGGVWTARDFDSSDPDEHVNTWALYHGLGDDAVVLDTGTVYVGDIYSRSSPALMDFDLDVLAGDVVRFVIDGSGAETPNYIGLDLEITVVPVPGAVLLGMLGLGVAGFRLRKF
jgi:hypothetical protein